MVWLQWHSNWFRTVLYPPPKQRNDNHCNLRSQSNGESKAGAWQLAPFFELSRPLSRNAEKQRTQRQDVYRLLLSSAISATLRLKTLRWSRSWASCFQGVGLLDHAISTPNLLRRVGASPTVAEGGVFDVGVSHAKLGLVPKLRNRFGVLRHTIAHCQCWIADTPANRPCLGSSCCVSIPSSISNTLEDSRARYQSLIGD